MRRRSLPFQIAWLLVVLFVGVAIVYESFVPPAELDILPIGVLMVVFSPVVLTILIRRRANPENLPRAYAGSAPNGDEALVMPRWRLPWRGTMIFGATLAGMFIFWAVEAALTPGNSAGVVLLALIAVVLALLPLFMLTGRVQAGGVYLTPTHIHHRLGGAVSSVRWDDITTMLGGRSEYDQTPAIIAKAVDQRYTAPFFRGAKLPKDEKAAEPATGRPVASQRRPHLFFSLADIYPAPGPIMDFLRFYWERPEARVELDQPAGLARFLQLTSPSGAERGGSNQRPGIQDLGSGHRLT